MIAQSETEISEVRAGIEKRLEALEADGFEMEMPKPESRFTNFLLAYHDLNDRSLQERIARFYRHVCPALTWTAPHCSSEKNKKGGKKLKIGIASAFLHNHTIGKLYGPLIEDLPRKDFEIILIRAGGPDDGMSRKLEDAADRVVRLSDSLSFARKAVADLELDVLFYPDIGMDALTYFLAFARLAPVQLTSLGHPMTTGLATMDFFLTAKTNEGDGFEAHYTEKPLVLSRGPVFMRRPEVPHEPLARDVLNLPKDWNATSLSKELDRKISRAELIQRILQEIEATYSKMGSDEVFQEWCSASATIGKPVRITSPSGDREGVALALSKDGALCLKTEDGTLRILAGDCIHLRALGAQSGEGV